MNHSLREKFEKFWREELDHSPNPSLDDITNFFLTEFTARLEEMEKEVEGMKYDVKVKIGDAHENRSVPMAYLAGQQHGEKCGYNDAIFEILSLIKTTKSKI